MTDHSGVLLFGGTFDPIHNGHLIISEWVADELGVTRIVLIPSACPPHKDTDRITPAADRAAMVEAAVADNPLFEVSRCELERSDTGPSYTLHTIRYLREQLGPTIPLYWLIGADTVRDLPSWYKVSTLVDECTIVTAARPGQSPADWIGLENVLTPEQIARLKQYVLDTPRIDVSSTAIRSRIAAGLAFDDLTPSAVVDYIQTKGLYRTPH